MKLNTVIVALLLFCSQHLLATECLLTDVNFPLEPCSFNNPTVNKSALRFGRIDRVEGENVIRSGANVYVIGELIEIHDTSNSDCAFNRSSIDDADEGKEIAFTLEGDSLRAPRVIDRLWLLSCEVSQQR